jgi:zinc protease
MIAICAPQNAPKVEAAFKEELARALKDGFTAEEVADGKKALLDERMVARTYDDNLASTLLQRERFDRTLKWDEALEAKIAALTPADVSAAFRRRVDPAAFIYVKGGDFQKAGVYQ